MKPFLCIDLTENKKNDQPNGSEFLVQTPSAALAAALDASTAKADATMEKSKLPMPLRIVYYICSFATILIVVGILRAGVSLTEGYSNAPGLYWTAGICGIISLILWLYGKSKSKTVFEEEESIQTFSHFESVANAIYKELAVPDIARDMDVLTFFYKEKDGVIRVKEKGMQLAPYVNPEYKIFADSKNIYLVDLNGKYAFPISSVTAIRTVKKHIRIVSWNKNVQMNKGIYKQYKLATDKYGCIHCKYYHIVEINRDNETCGIYIPCYELPVWEKLTGLKAQEL